MKKINHARIVFLIMLLGALNLSACTSSVNDTNLSATFAEISSSTEMESSAPAETEVRQIESDQMQWNVYISDDVPEHFIEVLKQYEAFMNAENQDLNDESVRSKLEGGEWQYLYMELCGCWQSVLEREGVAIAADEFAYSLVDLTGDRELELVMGQGNNPCVIYYYSDKDGIKTECTSSYFTMTLYEGGIIEYVSGGVDYTTTYLQFSEDTEAWEPKTEIEAQYIAEPIQLEWLPLLAENSSSEKVEVSIQRDSFPLVYEGSNTGVEILFEDCVCEYDKNGTKVYSYYVNDFDIEGYALYIENIEHTSTIFPVKDYLIDQEGENLYMLWGIDSFERIQGIDFVENLYGYKIQSTSSMERLISEAYGLEFLDDGTDFEDLQVEFTGIREDQKRFLCGKATAIYKRTGKQYTIEWEIDTDTYTESVKRYLTDMNMHPLYVDFLQGRLSVIYSFTYEGKQYDVECDFYDDKDYEGEHVFESAFKRFALVDVNNDDEQELIFMMRDRFGMNVKNLRIYRNRL